MMTSKTTRYPWDDLIVPHQACNGNYIARLVSEEVNPHNKKIFWARSWQGKPALLVEYKFEPWRQINVPDFQNIHVEDYQQENSIVIELIDMDMQELFLKLCHDIITSLQNVDERDCREACVLRLEKWSSFLRPNRSRMSVESQKGLIAELFFLKRDALEAHNEHDALRGWTGPEAGSRDFAYGQVFVEVKSKNGTSNPNVIISSENQLSISGAEHLYLYVVELNNASLGEGEGFTISDVVNETRESFQSPLARIELDAKLANMGYFSEDDYSDSRWSEGRTYYYVVEGDFSRIDSQSCMPGISKVSYRIDLDYCADYLVDRSTVIESME